MSYSQLYKFDVSTDGNVERGPPASAGITHSPPQSLDRSHRSSPSTAPPQDFNFDYLMFDDFYPLNGIIENVPGVSNAYWPVSDTA
jgi:hypothetical protein